jgi:hypothetical protein
MGKMLTDMGLSTRNVVLRGLAHRNPDHRSVSRQYFNWRRKRRGEDEHLDGRRRQRLRGGALVDSLLENYLRDHYE